MLALQAQLRAAGEEAARWRRAVAVPCSAAGDATLSGGATLASRRPRGARLAQLPAGARSALLTANMTNTSKRIARTGLMRARVSLLAVLTHERARRIRALNTLGSY